MPGDRLGNSDDAVRAEVRMYGKLRDGADGGDSNPTQQDFNAYGGDNMRDGRTGAFRQD